MIIVLDYSALNKQVAEQLTAHENSTFTYHPLALNFTNDGNKEKLVLLDLTANGSHPYLPGDTIADYLMAQGMPETITTIDILMPDIQNKLPQFASDLTNQLKNRYNRDVKVRCFLNSQYDYSFLDPTTGGNWTVYGVNSKDLPKEVKDISVKNLASVSRKAKLWEGTNLNDCFVYANQIYIARQTELAQLEAKTKFFSSPAEVSILQDKKLCKRKIKNSHHEHENDQQSAKKHLSGKPNQLKP